MCSPYAEAPAILHFGTAETKFYVPRHYLPSKWNESDTVEEFYFPDVDSRTGHAVVHYLYKETFEIPAFHTKYIINRLRLNLKAAILVFIAATEYDLAGLQLLAKHEINDSSRDLSLAVILKVIDEDFSRLGPDSWVHEFVRHKVRTAFESNRTVFANETFLQDVNDTALVKFVMRCIINLYNAQTAQTLDIKESPTEVQNEPETEDAPPSDDFSTISCPEPEAPTAYEPIVDSGCGTALDSPPSTSSRKWGKSEPEPEPEPEQQPITYVPYSWRPFIYKPIAGHAVVEEPAAVEMPDPIEESYPVEECHPVEEPDAVEEPTVIEVPDPIEESYPVDEPAAAVTEYHRAEDIYASYCPFQIRHVLKGDGWMHCRRCRAVVTRLAGQVS